MGIFTIFSGNSRSYFLATLLICQTVSTKHLRCFCSGLLFEFFQIYTQENEKSPSIRSFSFYAWNAPAHDGLSGLCSLRLRRRRQLLSCLVVKQTSPPAEDGRSEDASPRPHGRGRGASQWQPTVEGRRDSERMERERAGPGRPLKDRKRPRA